MKEDGMTGDMYGTGNRFIQNLVVKPKTKRSLEDLGVDERIILKWITKKKLD
jgi:hypothetical protein